MMARASEIIQELKRGGTSGRMWLIPDGSMYVYYTPTRWKESK
jgi:hypothetical protein